LLEDIRISVNARIRFVFAAGVLAAVYYYLLLYIVGWGMALHWPGWWFGAFPNRHIAGVTWLVTIHTGSVLLAALPVAIASVAIARDKAALLGVAAGVLAAAAGILPVLSPTIWPLVWSNHPIFFIADQIKIIAVVPFIAWVLFRVSSNNRFERPRSFDRFRR
jgi:hypothetical protein